jgi:TPR repeat protein
LNNLGICYEFGHGVLKDKDVAYSLYKEAANKGYAQAMSNLAHLSFSSANQSKSQNQYKEALVWFRKLSL